MRQFRTSGSVRGAAREGGPYRDSCGGCPEPGLVMVIAGTGLVFSPPSGPGVPELVAGGGHGRGGQAQQAAGFGDADLDLAGVFGR